MPLMHLPVLQILRSRSLIPDDEHVLRVLGFCVPGEIEASGDQGLPPR